MNRLLLLLICLWPAVAVAEEAVQVKVVASGLEHPWALAFLPDGRMLVSERPGRLRLVTVEGVVSSPIAGVPAVRAEGQGGLLDVALDPNFAANSQIYFTYAEPRGEGSTLAVARAKLTDAGLRSVATIFRAQPAVDTPNHYGSRLAFAADGSLFVSTGERWDYKEQAQSLSSHLGKILRLDANGKAMPDNPFVSTEGALPEIWSYGHRNVQALAFGADGTLWEAEHGARGGDEVNIIKPGLNYGWPEVTYSRDYITRMKIGEAETRADVEQPLQQWTPSFAPSGLMVYSGAAFPVWQGDLFIGALVQRHLKRLRVVEGKVVEEQKFLEAEGQRIRDVQQGPDGFIYVVTDEDDGKILRLEPAKPPAP